MPILPNSDQSKESKGSTCCAAERPASPSRLQDCERDWLIRVATWPSSFSDLLTGSGPDGWCGKMSRASIPLGQMSRRILRVKQPARLLRVLRALEKNSVLTQ